MPISTRDSLARALDALDRDRLSNDTLSRLALCVSDTLAVARLGRRSEAARSVERYAEASDGFRIGSGSARTPREAQLLAMYLAVSAHSMDFDDAALGTTCSHMSSVVVPTCLALAVQAGSATVDRTARAMAGGFLCEIVLAELINPWSYGRGFHPTAVLGTIASAVSAGIMLDLKTDLIAESIGIAASMSSGLKANFGTTTKQVHCGWPASSGIAAAMLAESGITSSTHVLEGRSGFASAFGDPEGIALRSQVAERALLDVDMALRTYPLLRKQWPCCASTYSAISGTLALRDDGMPDVQRIRCYIHPRRVGHIDILDPDDIEQARSSLQYLVATAARHGTVMQDGELIWPPDSETIALSRRVSIEDLATMVGTKESEKHPFGAVVVFEGTGGERLRGHLIEPDDALSSDGDGAVVLSKLLAAFGPSSDPAAILRQVEDLVRGERDSAADLLSLVLT